MSIATTAAVPLWWGVCEPGGGMVCLYCTYPSTFRARIRISDSVLAHVDQLSYVFRMFFTSVSGADRASISLLASMEVDFIQEYLSALPQLARCVSMARCVSIWHMIV